MIKILKFGGTSVGSAEAIRKVAAIILDYQQRNEEVAVVVSAMKGVTNQLISLGQMALEGDTSYEKELQELEQKHILAIQELIPLQQQSPALAYVKRLINELDDLLHGVYLLKELSSRTIDLTLSFGERLSAYLIAEHLKTHGMSALFCDARQLILTDDRFGGARVMYDKSYRKIREYFEQNKGVSIITGFIAANDKGVTTTLGRGGSDYTASLLGAALKVQEIEIWTDVDGVMTADPRQVKGAFTLQSISYIEAMEMSHFGAKVIYPPTLQPAFSNNIPLRIRNTFNPDFPGTFISHRTGEDQLVVKGISSIKEISLISVLGSGMVGVPGVSSRIFGALARAQVNVILITQASSEHSICFAVDPEDGLKAKWIIEEEFAQELQRRKIDKVQVEEKLSIVAIIGENMRNTPGISGKMFNALGKNGINVAAIAQGSSEVNLSVVINQSNLTKALNVLHESFFLSDIKSLNLFIVGTGLIGGTLLEQIKTQKEYLLKEKKLNLNIIGIANSRNMHFDEDGIGLENWKTLVDFPGSNSDTASFIRKMKALNLSNSVFVDCTSNAEVIKFYGDILTSSISIVTPNKLANSSSFADYQKLQKIAFQHGVKFLYETNVGAGLPVISTLQGLRVSGDKIIRIEGILSGTLSYIFNSFKAGSSFSQIVQEAQKGGLTEPDPREDLNGMDVARKILILAREAGKVTEPDEVQIRKILPDECMKAESVEAFFEKLATYDEAMEEQRKTAESEGKVLRYMACYTSEGIEVGLQSVGPEHPFYFLSGSDNIISFTTKRYKERPLVVKGPGAGAEVTAAGVFAEVISISNYLVQEPTLVKRNQKKADNLKESAATES